MFICIASSHQFRYNLRIRLCLYTIFRNHDANIVISLFIVKYRVKYLNIFSYCNRITFVGPKLLDDKFQNGSKNREAS